MGQNNSKQIQKGLQSRSPSEFVGPGMSRSASNQSIYMLCANAICRKGMGCQETWCQIWYHPNAIYKIKWHEHKKSLYKMNNINKTSQNLKVKLGCFCFRLCCCLCLRFCSSPCGTWSPWSRNGFATCFDVAIHHAAPGGRGVSR